MVLLLVDASIPPQAIDLECAMWLAESQVSMLALLPSERGWVGVGECCLFETISSHPWHNADVMPHLHFLTAP